MPTPGPCPRPWGVRGRTTASPYTSRTGSRPSTSRDPPPTSFLSSRSPPLPHRAEGGGTGDITAMAGGAAPQAHHFLGASRWRGQADGQWTVDRGQRTGDRRWAARARGAQPRP